LIYPGGLIMDVSQAVQSILVEMIKSAHGLQQVMLTDSTGLVLAQVAKEEGNFGIEGIGALASALYAGMQEQGESMMSMGQLGMVISEFAQGKLIMQGLTQNYVLIGVTRPRARIKQVRNTVKRYIRSLREQIQLLRTSEVIEKHQENGFESLEDALKELDF
jgi:predicted regulator of Ras-like GTPase activity (Roadblock/LC7/MglB family)